MKKIGALLALITLLWGDEIERINALVKEIEGMRTGYEKCQEQLQLWKGLSKEQNNTKAEVHTRSLKSLQETTKKEMSKLHTQIKSLENQIKEYENSLKTKSQEMERLQKEIARLKASQKAASAKNQRTKECKENSVIVIKEEKKQHLSLDGQKGVVLDKNYKITTTRPKTFRTLREADIYDKPEGKKIDRWVKGRSFTSYIESGNWVKITGYFVNRKWTEAKKDLWIRKSDAFERH